MAIILEELGLPYETKFIDFGNIKKEPYISVNPNGRYDPFFPHDELLFEISQRDLCLSVPAIEDPNTGITLWESGAIIEYLIDEYDTTGKISYNSKPEKYQLKQWLHFQMSGQGPYFGQAVWFDNYHAEKFPSAVERYRNEAKRVTSVLNTVLAKKEYLVGDKATYADLSFVTWYQLLPFIFKDVKVDWAGEYPHFHAWFERLQARPSVQKTTEDKKAAIGNQ